MFGLNKEPFNSNKAMYRACYRGLGLALVLLAVSVLVSLIIGLKQDTLYVLAQPSVVAMYLSGFLTLASLCWACYWSSQRKDDRAARSTRTRWR